MKATSLVALITGGALLVAVAIFVGSSDQGAPVRAVPRQERKEPEIPRLTRSSSVDAPRAPAPPSASSARRFPDEAALMSRLRELGQSDPARALEMAREGNDRFSGSADAPERYHTLIKALENLGRFDEAREEAQRMVDTYPGTPWTEDVERHVLRHPGKHPSQRGYYGE
jgi:hypothetical protein